jgi:hypothetical protein
MKKIHHANIKDKNLGSSINLQQNRFLNKDNCLGWGGTLHND